MGTSFSNWVLAALSEWGEEEGRGLRQRQARGIQQVDESTNTSLCVKRGWEGSGRGEAPRGVVHQYGYIYIYIQRERERE